MDDYAFCKQCGSVNKIDEQQEIDNGVIHQHFDCGHSRVVYDNEY